MENNEQKLIDLTFSIGLTISKDLWFIGKTDEQIAEWIADQLKKCGFETTPCGASWGVLKK